MADKPQLTQEQSNKIWAMLPKEAMLGAVIGYMTAAAGFVPDWAPINQPETVEVQAEQQPETEPEQ